jgi:hypothetical protein
VGGTPPLTSDQDQKARANRMDAERLLKSTELDPGGANATRALELLIEVPAAQRGKVIDGLDDKTFESLLDRVPFDQRERFAQLLGGSKDPRRKLRLWKESHMARARNHAARAKGDVGVDDLETEHKASKWTSQLSKKEQAKADRKWKRAHAKELDALTDDDGLPLPDRKRTRAQQDNLARHKRRVNQVTHTKEELDHDARELLAKKDLTMQEVDALVARKELESSIERKHNIDLTNSRGTTEDGTRQWTVEQLKDIQRTLARLPPDHLDRLDGVAEIERRPGYGRVGGVHGRQSVAIFDEGVDPAPSFRHGGDAREGTSDAYHAAHGRNVSTFEFVLTHELGHDVADTHAAAFEKFKRAAGWQEVGADALTKDNVTDGQRGLLDRQRKEDGYTSAGGTRRTYAPNRETEDKYWAVDRTAIPSWKQSAPGAQGSDTWDYARTNPGEHFAETYAKAVHVPTKLHDELVTRPAAEAKAARQAVAAQLQAMNAIPATAANEKKLAAMQLELDKRTARMDEAQRAVEQRGEQFSVMRNDVFHTDKATAAARARLVGRLDKTRLEEFEKQAAALSTPEQIATLEERFRR